MRFTPQSCGQTVQARSNSQAASARSLSSPVSQSCIYAGYGSVTFQWSSSICLTFGPGGTWTNRIRFPLPCYGYKILAACSTRRQHLIDLLEMIAFVPDRPAQCLAQRPLFPLMGKYLAAQLFGIRL